MAADTPRLGGGPDLSAAAGTPSLLSQQPSSDKPSLFYKLFPGICTQLNALGMGSQNDKVSKWSVTSRQQLQIVMSC